jgi:polyhydroxyalkanoate synthesis regulator phasin
MDNKKIMKELIAFHKASVDNFFSIMVTLQQQAENIFNFFYYLPIMTPEGKKFMTQRTNSYKKWVDDLKKAMDEGYAKIETFNNKQSMDMKHDHGKKMSNASLNQTNWIPQDLKNLLEELDVIYKKGCDEFMKYVDENRQQIVNYYNNLYKSQTKDKK